ncbi:dihydrolipoyl dehydrogenase [Pelagicoccus sp. SDUM812003]|uniref:dihydrolipoyl dehydrogenase n=1 Tax=Pelagicoccus sp. SDUM812003 TaxID=3041267 RepID=UPI00280F28E6|nr:dihydrolipoyl dehydrogenase [Pelagicoccus sp. SDUM812003]MDQ8202010.1 dihydrolipoyl dehydrogenase [Pelagicoccus sp. SDUM812003]
MSDKNSFDVAVIGGGPGGYVAAIRCAQLGLKTALVEKRKALGGTCLNIGCIPSKALLHTSEQFLFAKKHAKESGVEISGDVSLNLDTVMKKKDKVVKQLTGGVDMLVKKRGITRFNGHGKLLGDGKISVDEKDELSAKHIILATGSVPVELPFMKFDGETIVSSDHALSFDKVPEEFVVIGAGAIGLELGSVWSRYGSKVTVLEFLPKIAAGSDDDVSKFLERCFKKQGMTIHTETKVTGSKEIDGKLNVVAEKKGKEITVPADKVLVAVGRKPYTENLGLDKVGIEPDKRGFIEIDDHFKTSADGVYAIGDIVRGPMLAHKAEEEGVAIAEMIAGKAGHVNYDVIPGVIYTEPEVATVGLTEAQAKEKDIKVKVGKFPLAANGRAIASDATDGMVKIIACAETDKILGGQVVAKGASEMIAEIVTHMEYGGSAEDLGRTVHAHPTISESIKEAGLAVDGAAIHSL